MRLRRGAVLGSPGAQHVVQELEAADGGDERVLFHDAVGAKTAQASAHVLTRAGAR